MPQILIATGNEGKYREILEVLGDLHDFEFLSLRDLQFTNDVEESGETYEANSLLKAQYFFEKTGIITLAEDSGIEVEALKGELGVQTRRWGAGAEASDAQWLEHFLERMKREENRKAKFISVPTLIWGTGENERQQFRGETWGTLAFEPQCPIPKGIPISAVFVADGQSTVYAALSPEEKNAISHRGKAMHELKDFLDSNRWVYREEE